MSPQDNEAKKEDRRTPPKSIGRVIGLTENKEKSTKRTLQDVINEYEIEQLFTSIQGLLRD